MGCSRSRLAKNVADPRLKRTDSDSDQPYFQASQTGQPIDHQMPEHTFGVPTRSPTGMEMGSASNNQHIMLQ
jgi:hypothetical protein